MRVHTCICLYACMCMCPRPTREPSPPAALSSPAIRHRDPRCFADAPAGTPLDLGNAKNRPPPTRTGYLSPPTATLQPSTPPSAQHSTTERAANQHSQAPRSTSSLALMVQNIKLQSEGKRKKVEERRSMRGREWRRD